MNNIISLSTKEVKKYKQITVGEYEIGDLIEIWAPTEDKNGQYAKLEASVLTKYAKFKIIKEVKVYRNS